MNLIDVTEPPKVATVSLVNVLDAAAADAIALRNLLDQKDEEIRDEGEGEGFRVLFAFPDVLLDDEVVRRWLCVGESGHGFLRSHTAFLQRTARTAKPFISDCVNEEEDCELHCGRVPADCGRTGGGCRCGGRCPYRRADSWLSNHPEPSDWHRMTHYASACAALGPRGSTREMIHSGHCAPPSAFQA